MQQLAADTNAQQVRVLQQYADLYQKFLTGDTQSIDPAKAAKFFIEEGTSFAQRLAEMNLRVYNELFELSRGFNDRYVKLLGSMSGGGAKSSASGAKPAASGATAPAARSTGRPAAASRRRASAKKK
jgi:hypothetical protein